MDVSWPVTWFYKSNTAAVYRVHVRAAESNLLKFLPFSYKPQPLGILM